MTMVVQNKANWFGESSDDLFVKKSSLRLEFLGNPNFNGANEEVLLFLIKPTQIIE